MKVLVSQNVAHGRNLKTNKMEVVFKVIFLPITDLTNGE